MNPPAYIAGLSASLVSPSIGSARRASTLLVVLGIVALFIGGIAMLASFASDTTFQTADAKRLMTQMRIDSPDLLRIGLRIMAGGFWVYALIAVLTGLMLRRGTLVWIILALVLAVAVLFFLAVSILITLATGGTGNLVIPALLLGLHALITGWLIDALRVRARQKAEAILPDYATPMAGYHAPLPPPNVPAS